MTQTRRGAGGTCLGTPLPPGRLALEAPGGTPRFHPPQRRRGRRARGGVEEPRRRSRKEKVGSDMSEQRPVPPSPRAHGPLPPRASCRAGAQGNAAGCSASGAETTAGRGARAGARLRRLQAAPGSRGEGGPSPAAERSGRSEPASFRARARPVPPRQPEPGTPGCLLPPLPVSCFLVASLRSGHSRQQEGWGLLRPWAQADTRLLGDLDPKSFWPPTAEPGSPPTEPGATPAQLAELVAVPLRLKCHLQIRQKT